MLRKTLLGFAAASTLAVAALAPSAASAHGHGHHGHGHGHGGVSVHLGGFGPYWGGGYYSDYYADCFYKDVKVWSQKWHKFVWKTKKVCY